MPAIAERAGEELARIFDRARVRSPDLTGLIDELERVTGAGGKRLRPVLCVLGFRAVAGPDQPDERIFAAAASLELLHTFAILHDDVMDESMTRRGVASTLAAKGAPAAILAGDLAFALSDRVFAESGFPAQTLARAGKHLHQMRIDAIAGQHLEMTLAGDRSLDPESASRVARLKTGSYTVKGPLAIGAALADASDAAHTALEAFAAPLGEAFQLIDDLDGIDPRGAGDAEDTGSDDLRTGAPTYLVAIALGLASAEPRAAILRAWGVRTATEAQIEAARDALVECGAAEATLQRAASLIEESKAGLASSHRGSLNPEVVMVLNEVAASILEGHVHFTKP